MSSKKTEDLIMLTKDYSREPVPLSERRSWIPLTLIWLAMGVDLSALVLGSTLASGLTLLDAIIVVSIGSFILAVIGAVCSYVGSTTGLSTAMINRFAFGERGAYVVIIVASIAMFGWFGVTAGFFGESASYTLAAVTGLEINPKWLALVGGLLMTVTATIGYKAIEKLSMVAVPLMLGMLISMIYKLIAGGSENLNALLTIQPPDSMGIGMAISLVAGAFISACSHSPDVGRWAKKPSDAVLSGFFGFLIGNSLMMFLAAFLTRLTGTEDVIQIMLAIGWGFAAVIILILAQWTTNDNNMYSLGLNLSIMFKWVPKSVLTIIAGLLGTGLAVAGIYGRFIDFLTILSPFAAPFVGIYLVEYFFLNRSRFKMAFIYQHKVKPFYWHSLLVWGIASLLGLMTTPAADGGLGKLTLTQIPILDGLLTAMLLQFLLGKIIARIQQKKDLSKTTVA
ncbi:cytosine permease [Desmospora activa]|uniref:Cytosine permease n=1 Tax=Desmospora activa DSM 45169 TaxID=1121389 RepID=A0A2T4Z3M5_9BACL|nr:cytosine permease [Desmospora activa]PTM56493.1 cytosine permease [Desmospora activa DSM 45169]